MIRIARSVAAMMFAAVFLVFCYKIVMRYAAHDAVAWADEICVVLFIWLVFWANAFLVPDSAQIRFDLVCRVLPPRALRIVIVARHLLVGGLLLAGLPVVVDYTRFLWRERTPVLGLRQDWIYACFALFIAAALVRMAVQIWRLCGRNWQAEL